MQKIKTGLADYPKHLRAVHPDIDTLLCQLDPGHNGNCEYRWGSSDLYVHATWVNPETQRLQTLPRRLLDLAELDQFKLNGGEVLRGASERIEDLECRLHHLVEKLEKGLK